MTPYYEHAGVTIYHGDCREVMADVRTDFVVTDAQFGIADAAFKMGTMGGKRRGDNTWHPPSDWDKALDPAWSALTCTIAPAVAWFGHWRKRGEVEASMPHPLRCEIVWAKDMHCGPPCPTAMRDERIWVFSAAGLKPRRFETSVWDEPVIPTWSKKLHKNEKPLRLMSRLVSWLAAPGQTIADPFMGSGTTLLAAKELGVRAIGCDISEAHCETAAKRLSQETLPLAGDPVPAPAAVQEPLFARTGATP